MEKQIYNIASDTATLQQESNKIVLDQLAEQLSSLSDWQKVYNGILDNGGAYSLNGSLGLSSVNQTQQFNINVQMPAGTSATDGQALADTLSTALNNRGRYGMSPVIKKTTSL